MTYRDEVLNVATWLMAAAVANPESSGLLPAGRMREMEITRAFDIAVDLIAEVDRRCKTGGMG